MILRHQVCFVFCLLGTLLLAAGCDSARPLMPTPNLYTHGDIDPFAGLPEELRKNRAEILYFTDRAREPDAEGKPPYGYKRSRSMAFGVTSVHFGNDVSWDDLAKASRSAFRTVDVGMRVTGTTELVRFQPTPKTVIPAANEPIALSTASLNDPEFEVCRQELRTRLGKSPVKDVYLFVHGVKNTFHDGVMTIAELWHFLGRQGVAISYSWPAGGEGLLRGYNYDYNSSEFTIYHFKQAIRLLSSMPEVGRIHLIAHSRGTDVALTGLRELFLEIAGGGQSARDTLKLGSLVLAAADLDVDVFVQRAVTARLATVAQRTILYVSGADEALALSRFLFGGLRLGEIQASLFTPEELRAARNSKSIDIVDARVTRPGNLGHDYFYSNAAVSSDLILVIRDGRAAGTENGRPLKVEGDGFWSIDDHYPQLDEKPKPRSEPAG